MTFNRRDTDLKMVLFSDADLHSPKSQSGAFVAIVGRLGTFMPLEFSSAKQKPQSNSTPMSETIAGAALCQNNLLFASEIQNLLDVWAGVTPYTAWDELVYQRIPVMVDAKELERQSIRPIGKTIITLCTKLARDQLTWLTVKRYIQLKWLIGLLNCSDIGTKQHSNIVDLRTLCSVVLSWEDALKDWASRTEQPSKLMEMIHKVFEVIEVGPYVERIDIDYHLRIEWEISDVLVKELKTG